MMAQPPGTTEAVIESKEQASIDKSHVERNPNPPEYPTESLFQLKDRVWVVSSGSRGVGGPYRIVSVLANENYRLRDEFSDTEIQKPGTDLRRRL